MADQSPDILALDFDGVICDGLVEYFQTAWKAYCRVWTLEPQSPPSSLAERFYQLRPVVESGWEMPVLIRSLLLGASDDDIMADWQAIAHERIETEGLNPAALGTAVDDIRDEWIAADLDDWLAQHRFYPGVIDRLGELLSTKAMHVFIISTKEGRFIKQLLAQQMLDMPSEQIIGKEIRRPKYQTLRSLMETHRLNSEAAPSIWFVEDRLKTLKSVQAHEDLNPVQLFLADWGYNTASEREDARHDPQIQLLSRQQFLQDFTSWLS